MPLTKILKSRGAKGFVTAYGEAMFTPQADVARWMRQFSNTARRITAQEAPSNKRPRWKHYGKPLKSTFTATTRAQAAKFTVASAVGSTAPHVSYVELGTGVHGGNGPYIARILPPWTEGGPSLYEATWRPPRGAGVRAPEVAPVMISGQKGQGFMDKGMRRAFIAMRMTTIEVPSSPLINRSIETGASMLEGFLGNTQPTPAFTAQLKEWRQWRQNAYSNNRPLGENGGGSRYVQRKQAARAARRAEFADRDRVGRRRKRAQSRASSKRYRDKMRQTKAKSTKKKVDPTKKPVAGWASVEQKNAAAIAQFKKQNPRAVLLGRTPTGIVIMIGKNRVSVSWADLYNLID